MTMSSCGSTYTTIESTSRTNEKTSTNRATNGNHMQMSRLEGVVEQIVILRRGSPLEGLACNAHASPEAQLLMLDNDVVRRILWGGGVGQTNVFLILVRHGECFIEVLL